MNYISWNLVIAKTVESFNFVSSPPKFSNRINGDYTLITILDQLTSIISSSFQLLVFYIISDTHNGTITIMELSALSSSYE